MRSARSWGRSPKIVGCRAVGIAGSDEKVAWLVNELGFDAAFNYKTISNYVEALKKACPNGIDCYFDNVGGAITDAVFPVLNSKARISICGQISQYNALKPEMGPRIFVYLLTKQARAEGFLYFQFEGRYEESFAQISVWIREGKLKYREQIVQGFENTPRAFHRHSRRREHRKNAGQSRRCGRRVSGRIISSFSSSPALLQLRFTGHRILTCGNIPGPTTEEQ